MVRPTIAAWLRRLAFWINGGQCVARSPVDGTRCLNDRHACRFHVSQTRVW